VAGHNPAVLHTSPDGLRRWRGRPLVPKLRAQLASRCVLSVRLEGEDFEGRLFFLDKGGMTADDLNLGAIIARQVSADLNQFYAQQRSQRTAVSEERVRFARELHDGVLQFLTGLALQLKVTQRLLGTDPAAADARIADMRDLVAAEQADLRTFVRQMQPLPLSPTDVSGSLVDHLNELARRAERQWDLQVELTVGPLARQLLEPLARGVYRIMQEAFANAARHGQATVVRANLCVSGDRLQITVADDGRGFPLRGRHDLAVLARMDQGPVSLRERVASLGGDLIVDSSDAGARLEIALPLPASARAGPHSGTWCGGPASGTRAMPTASEHAD
jgi:signal transduction histidine kinase